MKKNSSLVFDDILSNIATKISAIYSDTIKDDISSFLVWVLDKIELCFAKKPNNIQISKGEIFFVHLGYNVGKEIIKTRPCVVLSQKHVNLGDMILVAPCTSAYDKLGKLKSKDSRYFVFVKKDTNNMLKNDSYISLTQIRFISKNRLDNKIGDIDLIALSKITTRLGKIIGIKNPT